VPCDCELVPALPYTSSLGERPMLTVSVLLGLCCRAGRMSEGVVVVPVDDQGERTLRQAIVVGMLVGILCDFKSQPDVDCVAGCQRVM
jgi:hypothetical protein